MSSLHLATGDPQPPKVEGKLRLYSMEFCPYAQRVRLVLLAKNIPHDIVNCNLINKPEWLSKLHPEAKVPALDTGSKVVVESLDIADFLDEEYAEVPLYPAEPEEKQKDKELIKKISFFQSALSQMFANKDKKTAADWLKEYDPHLDLFEKELEKRGKFFGGEKPGMVDYMLWPWAERGEGVRLLLGEKLPIPEGSYPLLRAWRKELRARPEVDKTYHTPEQFLKVVQMKFGKVKPDYDSI